jgi:hypothetical protein
MSYVVSNKWYVCRLYNTLFLLEIIVQAPMCVYLENLERKKKKKRVFTIKREMGTFNL